MSQDSNALVKPGRGGQRPGAGRPFGTKNRKPWQRFLDNVEAVTTRQFNKKTLQRMAAQDPFRFIERVAIPLAKPTLEILNATPPEQAPLIFVDDPQAEVGELIEGELAARGIDLREAVKE